MTPHLGASTEEAQENVGIEVAEAITDFLINGAVRNAVNLPNLDAKTYAVVKPYLVLGEKLGRLAAQLAPKRNDRLVVTYGGTSSRKSPATPLPATSWKGFLESAGGRDVNQVNVRALAQGLGLRVEEIKSNEATDFSEWLHLSVFSGDQKVSVGGTLYGSKQQPRIVRINSQPVELVPEGVMILFTNKDRPGIVGQLGTLLGRHQVNIANMSLSRDIAGGRPDVGLSVDSSAAGGRCAWAQCLPAGIELPGTRPRAVD